MPEEVIQAIMARRNPRTGSNYTRDDAERIYAKRLKSANGRWFQKYSQKGDVHNHGPHQEHEHAEGRMTHRHD